MAVLRAVISLLKPVSPPEAHKPRRRVVPVSIAAWIALIGVFVVPACCISKSITVHIRGSTLKNEVTYDSGVQSGAGEAGSTGERTGCSKLSPESSLILYRAIRLGGSIVKALILGSNSSSKSRDGESRRTHFEREEREANVMLRWMKRVGKRSKNEGFDFIE
jgi:hypothetical protein